LFRPGSAWNYSIAHDVLGRVIEVATGRPLDRFYTERIFEPLGMTDTGFQAKQADLGRLGALYAFDTETGKVSPNEKAVARHAR
jgi:CubicO group peptidase (beta-lactamase class C family)